MITGEPFFDRKERFPRIFFPGFSSSSRIAPQGVRYGTRCARKHHQQRDWIGGSQSLLRNHKRQKRSYKGIDRIIRTGTSRSQPALRFHIIINTQPIGHKSQRQRHQRIGQSGQPLSRQQRHEQ